MGPRLSERRTISVRMLPLGSSWKSWMLLPAGCRQAISPAPFEQARRKIEAKGMKLNNVFYACPREIPLGLAGADEAIEAWIRLLQVLGEENPKSPMLSRMSRSSLWPEKGFIKGDILKSCSFPPFMFQEGG